MSSRWRIVAVGIAVALALVALVLAVSGDGDGDVSEVASGSTSSSTTSSLATDESTSTSVSASGTSAASPAGSPATTAPRTAAPAAPRPAPPSTERPCTRPPVGSDFDEFGATEIVIENSAGSHRSCVLTADTPAQQQRGLMHQDDLDGYDGMIFRFSDESERSFWMRNTRIPLSIAFFTAGGSFVSSADMEPCGDSNDCPQYYSKGAAKYALEVIKGRLPAVGATAGSRLVS